MGGIKIKGRGPDKKRRKSRAKSREATTEESETPKKDILRDIINAVSDKVKRNKEEPWSLDIGPPVKVPVLGRHVFKREKTVEIDLGKL